jgi:hypothetical protein
MNDLLKKISEYLNRPVIGSEKNTAKSMDLPVGRDVRNEILRLAQILEDANSPRAIRDYSSERNDSPVIPVEERRKDNINRLRIIY